LTHNNSRSVLVIYSGRISDSKPLDPNPNSPFMVAPWLELEKSTLELNILKHQGLDIECEEVEPLDSCNVRPVVARSSSEA
jgi:hypothetical protein